jgi:hypothetical protein
VEKDAEEWRGWASSYLGRAEWDMRSGRKLFLRLGVRNAGGRVGEGRLALGVIAFWFSCKSQDGQSRALSREKNEGVLGEACWWQREEDRATLPL